MTVVPAAGPPAEGPPLLLHVIGSRGSFARVAGVLAALDARGEFRQALVDLCPQESRPSAATLASLGLPDPAHRIEPGRGRLGQRIARMLAAFERVLIEERPAVVVLAGDGDWTLACALAAAKLRIPIARVEAGLRSWNWGAGEEINRVLTDRLSDILFCDSVGDRAHLADEGVTDGRTYCVGNPVVDSLQRSAPAVRLRSACRELGLKAQGYLLVAIHRRATADGPGRAADLAEALARLADEIPVVMPVQPRLAAALGPSGMVAQISRGDLHCIRPLEWLDFVSLAADARAIVTDAGSVQEEASALGVPCYTMRAVTERRVTLTHGTNVLVGDDPGDLAGLMPLRRPAVLSPIPLWDGRAGERIADVLTANFTMQKGADVSL